MRAELELWASLDTDGKVNDENDSASIGGRVGSITGEGTSADVLRARGCAKVGEVGETCGERRRANDEIGVHEAGATFRCASEPPRERRAGSGGTGGMASLSLLWLLVEERRELADCEI